MIQNYSDVENKMRALVQEVFLDGIFLRTLRQGDYSLEQLQHFAVQYSYYSRHSPRVLGAAVSAMMPVGTWWIAIADNLWDEAGRGVPGHSHEQLYKTFLFSIYPDVELDAQGIPLEAMSPAVSTAIQTFIDFFRSAEPLAAMAAVGLGSEFFAGTVMADIADGFRHPAYNDRTLNLVFWDAHANEHEPRHYQLCKDILSQYNSPHDLERMYAVGTQIAKSEAKMYADLHKEMIQIG